MGFKNVANERYKCAYEILSKRKNGKAHIKMGDIVGCLENTDGVITLTVLNSAGAKIKSVGDEFAIIGEWMEASYRANEDYEFSSE